MRRESYYPSQDSKNRAARIRFIDWAIQVGQAFPGPLRRVPVLFSHTKRSDRQECLSYYHVCAMKRKISSWEPVYRFVKRIPRGRVVTYGQLARALRLPGGARTAGRAMAACPSGRGIPWHRVLGAGGRILIREPHASLQRRLLESEGTPLIEGRVGLKLHQWQPAQKRTVRRCVRASR